MAECKRAHEALRLRAELKRTSVKKFHKIYKELSTDDNRLRYSYQFSGAQRTGRTAGRGAQLQNLKRPSKLVKNNMEDIVESIRDNNPEWLRTIYGEPMDIVSGAIRASARADEGKQFVVADLHAIEACVGAWMSNCKPMLDVFNSGRDIYKDFATRMYRVPYEEVTIDQRQNSKPPVLGALFRLGPGEERLDDRTGDMKKTGLWGYAENMGITMTQKEAATAVEVYRESYPEVVQFWYDLERCAKKAVQTGRLVQLQRPEIWDGSLYVVPMAFDIQGPFLRFHLPDGSMLHYLRPRIEKVLTPWKDWKWTLTYEGQEDDGERKFWGRTPTHGGKLCENGVQAVANRLLRSGIRNAYEFGFSLCGESHDENIAHEKIDSERYTVENLVKCMTTKEKWMGALPLKAAGFTCIFYKKE
jgi:DNA polymerase